MIRQMTQTPAAPREAGSSNDRRVLSPAMPEPLPIPVLRGPTVALRPHATTDLDAILERCLDPETKRFTTTFNFVDVIGVGRSFGPSRTQELGLRLQHVSNAGIRVPNPGQNFVQLRYAASF